MRNLPVLDHRHPVGPEFTPPKTRGECIAGTDRTGSMEQRTSGTKQCGAYACKHNLLVVRSEDVCGKRYDGLAPEWTLAGDADASAPSCALDLAGKGPMTVREIAKAIGQTPRAVELVLRATLRNRGALELARVHGALGGEE